MPFGDWQFWVVTVVALIAAGVVLRTLMPRRRKRRKSARAELTVDGRPIK